MFFLENLRQRLTQTGRALLIIAAAVLTSCADPSPTPQPLLIASPVTAPRVSPTAVELPATWTPTFTWTPRPPTQTPTQTRTPTITPTPDAKAVCAVFSVFAMPSDGIKVAADGHVAYAWQGAPDDAAIYLTVINRETNEGILVQWVATDAYNKTVDMALLPASGVYDWTLSVHYETLGDLCPVSGWFERLEQISPTATGEATEATTEEATAEVTPEAGN